jgi:hypothetical protein
MILELIFYILNTDTTTLLSFTKKFKTEIKLLHLLI